MDTVNKATRSRVMSKVRSKETMLEKNFRIALWKKGIRYRKNSKNYFGKPDLLFISKKIVIFIDSCFWHGCKEHLRLPSSNVEYWNNKIARNIKRDKDVNDYYQKLNWKVIRIWEHELKDETSLNQKVQQLKKLVT